jgi:DNA modification methylase
MEINKIYQGDCLEVLKTFPDNKIDMCVTSPPYYGLRDYKIDGQLGLEKTIDEYLSRMIDIFREVNRAIKPEGTLWINLGDSYSGSGGAGGDWKTEKRKNDKWKSSYKGTISAKSLMLIPERFAIRMVDELGLILRNVIIWHKPSCLPESVKDRFTRDFEYIYFFSKQQKYYFKQQFEPLAASTLPRMKRGVSDSHKNINGAPGQTPHSLAKPRKNLTYVDTNDGAGGGQGVVGHSGYFKADGRPNFYEEGRNKRCVWKINTKPYKEAHFATFPPGLIETPIKAGCPEGGIILDPFFGSGTTGMVALEQTKNFVGIELNPEYIKLAEKRISKVQLDMF